MSQRPVSIAESVVHRVGAGGVTERTTQPLNGHRAQVTHYLFLVLEGNRPDAGGARIALDASDVLAIGRGKTRQLVNRSTRVAALEIPDRQMSSSHAQIVDVGDGHLINDAGSTNGTLVNGVPTTSCFLRDSDMIELGQTLLVYRAFAGDPRDARSLDARELAAQPRGFATLDPQLARALDRLARFAASRMSILLLGETGTGKELIARGLHQLSGRTGPFVAVNCGAIPPNLVESHLFGHVRGAFSGAVRDEPGLVRAAQHGTLLLDEIGDLPTESQAALLRMLQEREVRPVGSAQAIEVDVRVIAATHRPLETLIARGVFRRDLYARLAGYTFTLPPLRERRVDIGLVIAALLTGGTLEAPADLRIPGAAGRALLDHDWPMNIRELEQALCAACVLADDGMIAADDLPFAQRTPPAVRSTGEPPSRDEAPRGIDPRARLAALLAQHGHNVSAVARELATSRTQVHRLIARYGLSARP